MALSVTFYFLSKMIKVLMISGELFILKQDTPCDTHVYIFVSVRVVLKTYVQCTKIKFNGIQFYMLNFVTTSNLLT